MRIFLSLSFLPAFFIQAAFAQTPTDGETPDPVGDTLAVGGPEAAAPAPAPESADARMVASLRAQYEAIRIKRGEVQKLENELAAETNDVSREGVVKKLEKATRELNELVINFNENAAGIDIGLFEDKPKETFSWERQLGEILQPILAEMENATSVSRKIADLRQEKEAAEEKAQAAGRAVAHIESLLSETSEGPLDLVLREQLKIWKDRVSLSENRAESASLQLENLEKEEKGLLAGSTTYIREFLRKRGFNLAIGIGSALGVFFLVRLVLSVARRVRKTDNPKNLGSRVFVLTANLLSVLGAVAAMLVAFSATGDLFLFGIILLFLLAVAWGGVKVLPQFVESLKLILNVGMVKEGERIVFDGITWDVESLGFTSRLANRRLDDAVQILPVRHLVGHHSRPWCPDETEFPCRKGDWVQLADGRVGRTVAQNPGYVALEELGGARVTLPTPDFLALSPRNLSEGTFRVETRFGIDYRHRKECTTSIPAGMTEAVREGIGKLVGTENLRSAEVRFASAGASSLDYEVEVDLAGTVAPLYEEVQYGLQRILVDCCNANDWEIPFQQVTIHRA